MKFIDLFAGIGGFHLAFTRLGAKCVFASEIDEYARKTYIENFRDTLPEIFAGDITKVDAKDIPDFDILVGGFPCQPFSQAGLKRGFNESRGTLFLDIARILDEKKPKAFFLENVRGLLNHNDGQTLSIIRDTMHELGYSFYHKVVRASDFGLPQHRPRLFMVGFRDKSIEFKFPDPIKLEMSMSDVFGGICERRIGYTLRVGGRHSGIGDRRNWDTYIVDGKERSLGVKEALKMQGFPDNFKFPVSESQAMKQLGNSVAVPAVEAVAREIIKCLEKE